MTFDIEAIPSNATWCLVDSDPAIFTELIRQFGTNSVRVDEVPALELTDCLRTKGPIIGLIYASTYDADERLPTTYNEEDPDAKQVYFTSQVIVNSCATLALLGILLNTESIDIGPELQKFKEFTRGFDPVSRGIAVGSSNVIRNAHNSFSGVYIQIEAAIEKEESSNASKNGSSKWADDTTYHFISYVPCNGFVWELDGMKKAPIKIGQCTHTNWLDVAKQYIRQKMQTSETIEASVMAVVHDQMVDFEDRLKYYDCVSRIADEEIQKETATCHDVVQTIDQLRVSSKSNRGNLLWDTSYKNKDNSATQSGKRTLSEYMAMQEISETKIRALKDHRSQVFDMAQNIRETVDFLAYSARDEDERIDNIRRRHNYFPFLQSLFVKLEEQHLLDDLLKNAKTSPRKRRS